MRGSVVFPSGNDKNAQAKNAGKNQAESAAEDTDDSFEFPLSHSLPNMTWQDRGSNQDGGSDDSLFDDLDDKNAQEILEAQGIRKKGKDGSWQYTLKRDFPAEIEQYFSLKKLKA